MAADLDYTTVHLAPDLQCTRCGKLVRVWMAGGDMGNRPHVTDLLDAASRGDETARNELFNRAYDELKRMARGQVRNARNRVQINPTTLLHEAWIKLSRGETGELKGTAHFYNIFSQAMRHVLIDIVRSLDAPKHGQGLVRIELNERIEQPESALDDILAVESGLQQLQAFDPDLAQLVEWHFFGGVSFVDIAKERQVTERTVRRHWDVARIFLLNLMKSVRDPASNGDAMR